MTLRELYVCDTCGDTSRDEPGVGWEQNADGDDFCAACLKKHPLDPPDTDD
jgi:hypothetical protein